MTKTKDDLVHFEFLQIKMKEYILELLQRPPETVSIALVFAMTELIHARTSKETELPQSLEELIQEAGQEALTLTDEIFLAKPSSSETIH
jgi:hypothetical protein